MRSNPSSLVFVCLCLAWAGSAGADTAELTARKDTFLLEFEDARSNGRGQYLCTGQTGPGDTRRTLVQFDLTGIPAGSLITGVTLDLYVDKAAPDGGGSFNLHRLTADWGEGISDSDANPCQGAFAELNDATWYYRFYNPSDPPGSSAWTNPGGDFVAISSASTLLDDSLGHKFWSSAGMVEDVQTWLDGTNGNFGWLVKRDPESGQANALRFNSRQNVSASQRPRLTVDYVSAGAVGACCSAGQVCEELSAADCSAQGGAFQGENTDCTPNPCPAEPTGACCADDGTCSVVTEPTCTGSGGSYEGDGTDCAGIECTINLTPFIDPLPIPEVAQPVTGVPGGAAHYEIAMREVEQQLHTELPPTTVWGFGDGPAGATYPGPTIEAASDVPLTVSWINDLRDTSAPGDPKPLRVDHYLDVAGTAPPPECHIHGAEDLPKTVVHLHGAHVQAAFDGYPEFTYLPGNAEIYGYTNDQLPSTLWYHDHALGITRLNVYMGLAGFYIIRDEFELGLPLPTGEFEIPMVIQDRSFNPDGTLEYPAQWVEHYFGDKILVNGKIWPFLDVKQGKYRFRLLNGSGSRSYTLTLDRQDIPGTADVPFTMIGTDGGLMEVPLPLTEITLGPAERADIVVDFELMAPGTEVVMTNSAPAPFPGLPGLNVIPDVMKFVVQDATGHTAPLPVSLRPLEVLEETNAIKERDFDLDKQSDACGAIWTINELTWDDITEYPQLGTTEIWRFINTKNIMHPMHMHLVMFQVLDRTPVGGGPSLPPDPTEIGWKDTARAEAQMITRVIARFTDYTGKFAYHCHILEHEDHGMMRQFWTVEAIRVDVDRDQISWTTQPGATGYDVVRGDLVQLIATDGNFAMRTVTLDCAGDDVAGTSVADATTPSTGEGFWYLIRAVDAGGSGTYDSGHSSQFDFRDDEVSASGNDCP